MASWLNAMRITVQVIGSLFQLVAIGLILTALLTPAWQEVYFSMESQTFHQHGLWLDCVQSQRSGIVHAAGSGGWSCSYKFNAKQTGKEGSAHAPKTWQIITLSLLSGGGLFSLIGLFISYCICCPRLSAVLWAITNTFAAFTTAAGIIVFFRMSQAVENRIVIELTESYELKIIRLTFYVFGLVLQLFAIILFFVALLTPAWQELHTTTKFETYFQRGLCVDCLWKQRQNAIEEIDFIGWMCTCNFGTNHIFGDKVEEASEWDIATIGLISSSGLLSLIALFVAGLIDEPRFAGISWTLLNLFSTIASITAVNIFYNMSYIMQSKTSSDYYTIGYSFWLAFSACILQIIVLFCSTSYAVVGILIYQSMPHPVNTICINSIPPQQQVTTTTTTTTAATTLS
ncbi:hypothetical protein T07_11157 [Trichinella nelsoni]|uniref:Clc-like protein 2 n=1 Tax=Trichinella nelsoni TaxID=6336 RepID=A0A0V0RWU0_9BILA|nr:hypothetical protein T07_11157 [Trichinella nelsoni]